MWGDLADDLRRMPLPEPMRKNRAVANAFRAAVDELSETIDARFAKPAMKRCLDLAAKYMFADPRARACEQWLASHAKADFHVVDEIIPAIREASAVTLTADLRSAARPLPAPSPPPDR
jgi:hypothetical protein